MKIAMIGANGAIGAAMVSQLASRYAQASIYAFSRSPDLSAKPPIIPHAIDIENESSIEQAAIIAGKDGTLDLVIVATGLLHGPDVSPEKSLKDLSITQFQRSFAVNTIGPAMVAKHFLPLLHKDQRAIFAALSARVGSISDNYLGGWYAYRASKAALNMVIKNASIEMKRRYKHAIILGLHPGTVDSKLSKPFQSNVAQGKLFTPDIAASHLLKLLENKTPEDSGKIFAWDDSEIPY